MAEERFMVVPVIDRDTDLRLFAQDVARGVFTLTKDDKEQ
jgi:hypothetical protein